MWLAKELFPPETLKWQLWFAFQPTEGHAHTLHMGSLGLQSPGRQESRVVKHTAQPWPDSCVRINAFGR